jgi:hypothetical protein
MKASNAGSEPPALRGFIESEAGASMELQGSPNKVEGQGVLQFRKFFVGHNLPIATPFDEKVFDFIG